MAAFEPVGGPASNAVGGLSATVRSILSGCLARQTVRESDNETPPRIPCSACHGRRWGRERRRARPDPRQALPSRCLRRQAVADYRRRRGWRREHDRDRAHSHWAVASRLAPAGRKRKCGRAPPSVRAPRGLNTPPDCKLLTRGLCKVTCACASVDFHVSPCRGH
jgi:hypothetical protein